MTWVTLFFFFLVMVILFSDAGAAVLALVFSVGMIGVSLLPRTLWRREIITALLAVMLVAPAVMGQTTARQDIPAALPHGLENPISTRLGIWQYSFEKAMESPLMGKGLDASRHIAPDPDAVWEDRRHVRLHPHNAALQIFLELGLVGFVFFAALIFHLGWQISSHTDPRQRALLMATLVSTLTIASSSYGVWQSWWMATLVLISFVTHLAFEKR